MKFFQNNKEKNLLAQILIICAFLLIVAGTLNGEIYTVLNKSIAICMECIGIG